MLTQILFGAYCVIGGSWILKTFGDFRKWKNDTRILQYLQVSLILLLGGAIHLSNWVWSTDQSENFINICLVWYKKLLHFELGCDNGFGSLECKRSHDGCNENFIWSQRKRKERFPELLQRIRAVFKLIICQSLIGSLYVTRWRDQHRFDQWERVWTLTKVVWQMTNEDIDDVKKLAKSDWFIPN